MGNIIDALRKKSKTGTCKTSHSNDGTKEGDILKNGKDG